MNKRAAGFARGTALGKYRFCLLDAVVVNDASTDPTERAARNSGAAMLSLTANLGIGDA